jgi:D-xylose transport system ATP-binding protein
LGVRESAQVLDLVRSLPERGVSVILISHNMDQVAQVAHRAVVLRQGRVAGSMVPTRENVPQLVSMIMGVVPH